MKTIDIAAGYRRVMKRFQRIMARLAQEDERTELGYGTLAIYGLEGGSGGSAQGIEARKGGDALCPICGGKLCGDAIPVCRGCAAPSSDESPVTK